MLYPLGQAIYYIVIAAIILCIVGYTFHTQLARFIGRSKSQIKRAHKEVLKEYQSGMEEEEQ